MKILKNECMKKYSNMKIGGIAKEVIFIEKEEELLDIFKNVNRYYILGNGTNTLINDSYLDISFISLKKLNKIERLDDERVLVESGADLIDLITFMEKEDLSGIENLTGIPGSVGGLVNMNGGAYNVTIFDFIESVKVLNDKEEIIVLKKEDIDFRYRTTEIKENKWVVISTIFKFNKGFKKEDSLDKIEKRKNNHPLDFPNLGSTFKNPKGTFAAQLISDCDLKGYRIGDIQISEKHPNFLINYGNAKFEEVIKLISHIKKVVFEKTNIMLETEIVIIDK